jgi:serine/threonine protein kinase
LDGAARPRALTAPPARPAEVLVCPDKRLPHENKELGHLAYSAKVDAWACGVLAFELLVGSPPFGMASREASVKAILHHQPRVPQWLSPPAADFVLWALTKKPSRRPAVMDLLAHSWVQCHMCAPPPDRHRRLNSKFKHVLGAREPCQTIARSVPLSTVSVLRVACGPVACLWASSHAALRPPMLWHPCGGSPGEAAPGACCSSPGP